MTWQLPGFDVGELIGFGGSGEVWRATDSSTHAPVALKRLRVGQQPAEHDRLRREAAVLAAFAHPHVVRLLGVIPTADGLVLVLDLASGGSLGGLVARRGRCTPAEVIGLLVRLADALAAAHAAGLTHGDVSPGNVLIAGDGTPLLADLGTARLLADGPAPAAGTPGYVDPAIRAGHPAGPASDVYSLAAVAVHALTGAPPGPEPANALQPIPIPATLRRLLRQALDRDPVGRPSAAALASDLLALGVQEPLRLPPPFASPVAPEVLTHAVDRVVPAVPRPRPRRGRRVLAGTAVGIVLLIGVLAAGLLWGPSGTGRRPSTVDVTRAPAWDRVWTDLDARRGQAFATADATLLDQVYLPGCLELAADLHAVRDLAGRHARATGVVHELRSVRVESVAGGAAILIVTERMGAYQVRASTGAVLQNALPRGDRRLRARLVDSEAGWRIASLAAV